MTLPSVMRVVLVRWKQEASADEVDELAVSVRDFPVTIPGVLAASCGPSSSPEGLEGGFQWGLVVSFASSSARDEYLPHPAHQPVAALISRLAEQIVVFDVDA